ncbi:MAG: hypothetical protein ACK5NB_07225, partial [Flavobacteriaceae bacterium]
MKTIFLSVFFLCTVGALAQRVESEIVIYANDTIPAKLINLDSEKGFAFNVFSKSDIIPANQYGVVSIVSDVDLIKENRSYPDYIVELEIIDKPYKTFVYEKTDSKTNIKTKDLYVISEFEGVLYVSDRDKGLMYTSPVTLKSSTSNLKFSGADHVSNYSWDTKLSGSDYANTVYAIKNLSDSQLSNYAKPNGNDSWVVGKEHLDKVNNIQIHKLFAKANNIVLSLFRNTIKSNPYYFYNIKKWKENESMLNEYNTVVEAITKSINTNNPVDLNGNIPKLEALLLQIDSNDKKQKKLYAATLENISLSQFFDKNYDGAIQTIQKLRNFEDNKNALKKVTDLIEEKRNKNESASIEYKTIPEELNYTKTIISKEKGEINNVVPSNAYNNHLVSNMLTLYTINKATAPTYAEKIKTAANVEFGYKSIVYSDIKGLRDNNTFYKKQFPDFYKTLKIIKNRMGEIKDETGNHNAVINQFFKEYS